MLAGLFNFFAFVYDPLFFALSGYSFNFPSKVASAVTPSKRGLVNTNRKSTMYFSVSLR